MKRAIGWNLGLRGDIILNTVVARSFKEQCPDWHVTLGVGPQFADMEPLFHQHPHIDAFHAYKSYDNWPSQEDKDYLATVHYDTIFNGMPRHTHDRWYDYIHQAEEVCWMHGLRPPSDGIHCQLNLWFEVDKNRDTIAFAPFAGWYNQQNDKKLTIERAQDIVNLICDKGYKVLQIGGPGEPALEGVAFPQTSYFNSIRAILGCKLFIHSDTGAGWAASAYGFPQLGLYSHRYYGANRVSAIQPVNQNAIYLSEDNVNQIDLDKVVQSIDNLTR